MIDTDEENLRKIIEEAKTKIIWELTNKEDIECILFADGKIHGGTGDTNKILNALSNLVMSLTQLGISKSALKQAFKIGLNWERYVVDE